MVAINHHPEIATPQTARTDKGRTDRRNATPVIPSWSLNRDSPKIECQRQKKAVNETKIGVVAARTAVAGATQTFQSLPRSISRQQKNNPPRGHMTIAIQPAIVTICLACVSESPGTMIRSNISISSGRKMAGIQITKPPKAIADRCFVAVVKRLDSFCDMELYWSSRPKCHAETRKKPMTVATGNNTHDKATIALRLKYPGKNIIHQWLSNRDSRSRRPVQWSSPP